MGGQPFSYPQLLAAYRAEKKAHNRSDKASRQFIDRNLTRLVNEGLVVAIDNFDKKERLYRLTDSLRSRQSHRAESTPNHWLKTDTDVLIRRLREQQTALLMATGEIEILDELCAELPHLHNTMQPIYNDARDRLSKLSGKVKALESMISPSKPTPL